MDWVVIIGSVAAVCSTASFVPQAWKVIRSRDTSAISRPMYLLTVVGFVLWSSYGVLRGEWPIIVPNVICCVLSAFILVMTLLPDSSKKTVREAVGVDG